MCSHAFKFQKQEWYEVLSVYCLSYGENLKGGSRCRAIKSSTAPSTSSHCQRSLTWLHFCASCEVRIKKLAIISNLWAIIGESEQHPSRLIFQNCKSMTFNDNCMLRHPFWSQHGSCRDKMQTSLEKSLRQVSPGKTSRRTVAAGSVMQSWPIAMQFAKFLVLCTGVLLIFYTSISFKIPNLCRVSYNLARWRGARLSGQVLSIQAQ